MAHTNLSVFYQKLGRIEDAETEKAKATTLAFQNAMRDKLASQKVIKTPEPTPDADLKNSSENTQNDAQNAPKTPENTLEKLRQRLTLFDQALAFVPEDKLALQGKASVLLQMIEVMMASGLSEGRATLIESGDSIARQLGDSKLQAQFREAEAKSKV
jgi:hypothetical protein